MPKRNIIWILVGAVIAVLLWKGPENWLRRDALYYQFGPLLDVRVQVRNHYVEEVSDETLLRAALRGMLNHLDRYSDYYTQEEYEQFQKKTKGRFPGIGIEVGQTANGDLLVISPIEGSPAFREDVRAGDRITGIDGKETRSLTVARAVKLIEGAVGTTVSLTIYRPSSDVTLEKRITREIVEVPTIRGWARSDRWEWDYVIDPQERIGYVRILGFEGQTAIQFDAVMQKLWNENRIRGLILDVRDNPGGLLQVVVEIADKFLADGKIVSTKGRLAPEKPSIATRENTYPDFPIVVLVNHGSASASEILAGALRDYGRATVVGEQTFGKGSVQELIPIENSNGAVKLTTAYYYLPKGERIHGKGVVPDRIIDLTPEERDELIESQRAVYSPRHSSPPAPTSEPATAPLIPATTAPASMPVATSSAPADDDDGRVEIIIDLQLEESLGVIRDALAAEADKD